MCFFFIVLLLSWDEKCLSCGLFVVCIIIWVEIFENWSFCNFINYVFFFVVLNFFFFLLKISLFKCCLFLLYWFYFFFYIKEDSLFCVGEVLVLFCYFFIINRFIFVVLKVRFLKILFLNDLLSEYNLYFSWKKISVWFKRVVFFVVWVC